MFLCGLLVGGLALTQVDTAGDASSGRGLRLPAAFDQVLAQELVTLTPIADNPEPEVTRVLEEPDVLVRGFDGVTDNSTTRAGRERKLLTHIVQPGDTVFGIALQYGLLPETVLWSNYLTLKDNPDLLSLGQELKIPPDDGLVYTVESGDTVEAIARRFQVEPEAIFADPINALTPGAQPLEPGRLIFVPGGEREVVVWQLPKPVEVRRTTRGIPVYRVGVCGEIEVPNLGSGRFAFPTNRRYLSGYTFGPSHGGWDLAGRLGEPIYASDGGTVVYAGYSLDSRGRPRGYGQYVVLDHGNGYRTLYAHASQLYVQCGQQVARGAVIAAVGSVGKSTGPHLHFEIRYGSNYVNPAQFMTLQAR